MREIILWTERYRDDELRIARVFNKLPSFSISYILNGYAVNLVLTQDTNR